MAKVTMRGPLPGETVFGGGAGAIFLRPRASRDSQPSNTTEAPPTMSEAELNEQKAFLRTELRLLGLDPDEAMNITVAKPSASTPSTSADKPDKP